MLVDSIHSSGRCEMKHTKGPWTYEYDTCKSCEESGTKEFTIVGPPGAYHGQFSNEDDARLIAAAPELLAKLIEADRLITQLATVIANPKIADHIPYGLDERCNEWLQRGATTVIAKAEGE